GAFWQAFAFEYIESGQGSSACQRIAAKGTTMDTLADASALRHTRAETDRPHRDAPGQGLCQAEDIGLQVIVVTRKELPCASEACLYFVADEQGPAFATERCQAGYVLLGGSMHAPFSLHEFDDDCRCLLANG